METRNIQTIDKFGREVARPLQRHGYSRDQAFKAVEHDFSRLVLLDFVGGFYPETTAFAIIQQKRDRQDT